MITPIIVHETEHYRVLSNWDVISKVTWRLISWVDIRRIEELYWLVNKWEAEGRY